MDAPLAAALKRLDALADALEKVAAVGAEAYANGGGRARPIVDQHFTAGNGQRLGWEPLSQAYAMRKAGQAGALRRGMKAAGRTVSKMDPNVAFKSSTGEMVGYGSGANLPMLVRTGRLRQAVVSPTLHRIALAGDVATITFSGLPDYAEYHHTGTSKLPKRSPVEPGYEDIEQVTAAMRKFLDAVTGGGGYVQQSRTSVPGVARVAE